MKVKDSLASLAKVAPQLLRDVAGVAGVAAVIRGMAMISEPAAWILGGILTFFVAALLSGKPKA